MIAIMIDLKLARYTDVIKYTFSFVFETLGYPYRFIQRMSELSNDDILFCYALIEPLEEEIQEFASERLVFFIPAEVDLLTQGKMTFETLREQLQEINLFSRTPVISKRKIDKPVVTKSVGSVFWGEFKFDIIGNIFFNLSGFYDLYPKPGDEGVSSNDFTQLMYNYNSFPYVNSYLWMIESFIKEAITKNPITFLIKKEFWPGGENYAYTISHNIDSLHKWTIPKLLKSFFSDTYYFLTFKWGSLLSRFWEKLKYLATNYEVYWNFDDVRVILENSKTRATFFVHTQDNLDLNENTGYTINDEDLLEELSILLKGQNEVLPLINSYGDNPKEINAGLDTLSLHISRKIKGVRYKFGGSINPQDINTISESNVIFNSSRATSHRNGFFNGIAYPFQEYNSNVSAKYWELPINFSDNVFQLGKYNFLPKDKAVETVKSALSSIQRTNGLLNFCFSTSKISDVPYNKQLLDFTLKIMSQGRGYNTTLSELAEWWEARSSIEVTESEGEIKLHFLKGVPKIKLKIYGNRTAKKISNAAGVIKDNVIQLESIKEGEIVRIYAPTDEQIYLNIKQDSNDQFHTDN